MRRAILILFCLAPSLVQAQEAVPPCNVLTGVGCSGVTVIAYPVTPKPSKLERGLIIAAVGTLAIDAALSCRDASRRPQFYLDSPAATCARMVSARVALSTGLFLTTGKPRIVLSLMVIGVSGIGIGVQILDGAK